ncbi:hypothetical protein IWQ52_004295 [Labrenzia sp. EL_159]|nr:hypothetical protein [Labrenzia sp. EL_162]MBG6196759.1 hypothetical protein [Labrenzia sp. EL_159]
MPLIDCVSFDCFTLEHDGFTTPEADIGRHQVAEALVPLGVAGNACRSADCGDDRSG